MLFSTHSTDLIKLPAVSGNISPEYIFYSNGTHISYIHVDDSKSTAVLEAQSATLGYDQLTYRLWYKSDVNLFSANLDGSDVQPVSAPTSFGAFTVDAGNETIYYLHKDDMTVKSIDYEGNSLPDIPGLQGEHEFQDLQIDATKRSVIAIIYQ